MVGEGSMPFAGPRMPWGASEGPRHPTPRGPPGRRSWAISSVTVRNFFLKGYAGLRAFQRQRLEKKKPQGLRKVAQPSGWDVGRGEARGYRVGGGPSWGGVVGVGAPG